MTSVSLLQESDLHGITVWGTEEMLIEDIVA
jgi:hypothetical protein